MQILCPVKQERCTKKVDSEEAEGSNVYVSHSSLECTLTVTVARMWVFSAQIHTVTRWYETPASFLGAAFRF